MYDGYFALGGREIGNSPRAVGLQRSAECPIRWLDYDEDDCPTLAPALGDDAYSIESIAEAPWYDPDNPDRSSRILGLNIVTMTGIQDDTRQAAMEERVTKGAHIGRTRRAGRQVRILAMVTAFGEDALDAGMTWLRGALDAKDCGLHGSACQLTDFEFFTSCPPDRDDMAPGTTDDEFNAEVDLYRRYLHDVRVISGPYIVQELKSRRNPGYVGNIVEFTVGCEVPEVFTKPLEISVNPTLPAVINDVPFNFALQPRPVNSIEPRVVATKNLSTNPSLEVDGTGWTGSVASVSGSAPGSYFTHGRQVGELAANGVASYRARMLGNGSTTASGRARMTVQHDVTLDDVNERVSLNIWAAAVSVGGATGAALVSVTAKVEWRTAGALISTATIGTSTAPADIAGKAWTLLSQKPPATAVIARVIVEFVVDWSSSATPASNSDIRAYVDAAAVTVP